MNKLNILLVDDEAEIRQLLTDLLESKGHNVETAKDGQEALDFIFRKNYDLILLDNQMPIKSGEELLKDISKIVSRSFKVIFISGAKENLLQLVEENDCYHVVDYVLNKPFSIKNLEEVISQIFTPQH